MVEAQKVKEQYLDTRHYEYHRHQYAAPKRSTIALCKFVENVIGDVHRRYTAVDIACGGGANIYHLSKVLPDTKWTGLDFADQCFDVAGEFVRDKEKFRFVKGDLYQLSSQFPAKSFDISFSIQTLSWLPNYEEPLKQMMAITGGWIFITSLFSDFNVDVFSTVCEYERNWSQKKDSPYNYNVYSLGKLKEFCRRQGASDVIAADFTIDIDLPMPTDKLMGTYTVKDMDGRRIQFSGPLHMPWKMLAIRM